jgi:hypothetical protein
MRSSQVEVESISSIHGDATIMSSVSPIWLFFGGKLGKIGCEHSQECVNVSVKLLVWEALEFEFCRRGIIRNATLLQHIMYTPIDQLQKNCVPSEFVT